MEPLDTDTVCFRCCILGCTSVEKPSWLGDQGTCNVRCLRPAWRLLYVYVCVRASNRYYVLFAWYMALAEPRNSGTKTLCKRLSPGKLEIMIFIVTCAPLLYAGFLENPGQNISYTYLHDNCITASLSPF